MKRNRLFTLMLALVFTFTSVQLTFAGDVSDNFNKKTPNIDTNTMVNGKFEKSSDMDAYTFISGGGKYKVVFYTKTPAIDEFMVEMNELYDMDENVNILPLELHYSTFAKFSAVGGEPPTFQWGGSGINSIDSIEVKPTSDGWYVGEIELDKFKKNAKVGIRFDATKKGAYKFKVVGANSPKAKKTTLAKVKGKKKAATLKWKKSSGAAGYQIQYSKDKNFKSGVKSVKVKKGSTLKKTISIKKKGKYYFRVRAYKKVVDVKVYGSWSKVKSAKVK